MGAMCRVCGRDLDASKFYKSQLRVCGAIGECKDCTCRRVRMRREQYENARAYDRARAKFPHRVEIRTRVTREWREKNPQAYKAHNAVSNALRDGRLIKEPCVECGSSNDLHAHHGDYANVFDVTWLCARCHHQLHADPANEGLNKVVGR